ALTMNATAKDAIHAELACAELGPLDRVLRRQLLERSRALRFGQILIEDSCGAVMLGEQTGECGLRVRVQVLDPRSYRAMATNGSVGAGEAYMQGYWRCDDLVALVRLLVRNRDLLDGMEGGLASLGGAA